VVSAARAVVAIDGGDLPLGGGLLALLRPALDRAGPGGVVALLSSARSVREDLERWCRVERHEYLGCEDQEGHTRHLIARGTLAVPRPGSAAPPERADPATGFAPHDARVEPGGPTFPFALVERDRVQPPETRELYDRAVASQWDANRDVPWDKLRALPPALDVAVGQIFSFLAENELSALYVPARFLPAIHPAYVDTAMLLAMQLADESRHIDVFLRRARATAAGPGVSSATTSRSLHFLVASPDFSEAMFLLSVLGEGTFLDLLRFIEEHAPDEATAELTRRARVDEARHVHFGLAHSRHALAHDPGLAARLTAAVRRRSANLHEAGGVPAPIADALTILAARGDDPRSVARGHEAFRALLQTMAENRKKRLLHGGFRDDEAQLLSDLHTPNFM
jgi:TusA-related sulfurtransferase